MDVTPERCRPSRRNFSTRAQPLHRHSPAGEERGGLMASAPRSESTAAVPAARPRAAGHLAAARARALFRTAWKSFSSNPTRFRNLPAQLFFRSGNAVTAATAPGLADMTATVARTGTTSAHQPPDRRRLAAHGRGSFFGRGSGHQRDFLRGACGFFERSAEAGFRTGAAGFLSRRRIRARTAAARRRPANRAHHARLSGQRAAAPRAVRRASLRHDFADRSASRRLPRSNSSRIFTGSTIARETRCW